METQQTHQWFFLHIPKCAGTTFIHLLDQYFVQDEILPEHDRFLPLRRWKTEEIQQYPWVRGHFPYAEVVPRLDTPLMLILMRDPVEMFLSHVEMRRRLFYPDETLSQRVYKKPLDKILQDDIALAYFNNFAAKMLGGTFPDAEAEGDPTNVWSEATIDLDLAQHHLEQFALVGLVEEFDTTLRHLEHLLNFPLIRNYRTANVSPKRSRRSDLSPATIRRIETINALDIQLYRLARSLFEHQHQILLKKKVLLQQIETVEDNLHRVYPGQGWYPGERHPFHGVVRWTGPERVSRLFYPLKGKKSRWLRIEVVNWAAEDIIEGVRCEVNGVPLDLRRHQVLWENQSPGWILEAKVPSTYWQLEGWQEIALHVPHTVQLPGESRELGICCRQVTIH